MRSGREPRISPSARPPLVTPPRRRLGRQIHVHVQGDDGRRRLGHREVERDEERVVEAPVLRVQQIEPALDPLLDHGAGQALVNRKPILVGSERAGAFSAHVHGQGGHGIEEERLDVIAGDDGQRIGPERGQPRLDPGKGGVDAKDQVAIFRVGPRDELGRVRQRKGADQHQALPWAAALSTVCGMMRRAAITGRGDVPMRSSPTTESSMYASRGSRPVRETTSWTAPRAQSSVAASTVGPKPSTCTVSSISRIGRSSVRRFSSPIRARTVASHSTPAPPMMPSLIAAWGSAKKTSAPSTSTGRCTRQPARTSFWSKSPPYAPAYDGLYPSGGIVETVPRFGASGIGIRPPNHARPSLIGQESAIGSGKSVRRTPKSRRIAVLPSPWGVISSRSTTTASPGSAPFTRTGPAIGASGWPLQAGVNGVGTRRMSETSRSAPPTSSVNASPGVTVSAGGVAGVTSKRYQVRAAVMSSPSAPLRRRPCRPAPALPPASAAGSDAARPGCDIQSPRARRP